MEIILTQGKVATVDDSMFELLDSYRWYAQRIRIHWYAVRQQTMGPGTRKAKNRVKVFMHHVVAGFPLQKLVVDHCNGDGLDNRIGNLRHVTIRQNTQNNSSRRMGLTSSSYFGVSWYKKYRKWVAQIDLQGKKKNLGYFNRESDAGKAYQKAFDDFTVTKI